MIEKEKIAIIAITKHGVALAEKLHAGLEKSELFISMKFKKEIPGKVQFFETPIKDLTEKIFNPYDALVYIVSLGP